MRVTASVSIKYGTTVEELKKSLQVVPDNAKMNIRSYTADRPGESSYSTIEFVWEI